MISIPSQTENCWKSVLWRSPTKVYIVQNHTFPRPPHPPKVEIAQKHSFQDHCTLITYLHKPFNIFSFKTIS